MNRQLSIGIIGDFDPDLASHVATNDALKHAAESLSLDVRITWPATPELKNRSAEFHLRQFDGLWGAPGSPYRSTKGALNAIRFCREHRWPFLGT